MNKREAGPVLLPDCRQCAAGRSGLYGLVLQKNCDLIQSCRRDVVRLGPNRMVIRQDQQAPAIYTLRRGWLYRYRRLANGRQQITSFIIPGDTITLSSILMPDMPIGHGIKTASDAELCSFDRSVYRRHIAQHPDFQGPYQRALALYIGSLHRRIADIGQRSARGRLAQLLIEFFERHQERGFLVDNGFDFPVSQELLAKAAGLTKAYVNRILGGLKLAGIIELEKRRLRIADIGRLREIGEEE